MRGAPSPWVRVRRLEGQRHDAGVRRLADELAAELGMSAEQVLAEARDFADWLAEQGATTFAAMCDVIAAAEGLDPAEVRAEAERLMAGLGR